MKQRKIHYAWIILISVCLFGFLAQGLVLGTFGSYTISIADSLGVGQTQVSLAMTCEMLGIAIAFPILGGIMRKVSLRLIAAIGVVATAAGLVLASFAQSVIPLYVAWALIGASSSVALMLPMLNGNWFADKLGLATGLSAAVASVGTAVFTPLATWLIGQFGWRISYRISAVIELVVLIPVALFTLKFAPGEGEQPYGADRIKQNSAANAVPAAGADDGLTFRQALRAPLFYLILLGSALFAVFSSIFQQVQPHLTSSGIPAETAAFIVSCMSICSATGKVVIGPFLDGKHRNLAITLVAIFESAGWALIAMVPGVPLTFLGAAIGGLGQCCGLVAIPYLSRRYFGGKDMAKISGISGALCTLVPAVGIIISAMVFDTTGSYAPVFLFASIATILVALSVLVGYNVAIKKRLTAEMKS